MLCSALLAVTTMASLRQGSHFNEPLGPQAQSLNGPERWYFNAGRDAGLNSMLSFAGAYPACPYEGEDSRTLFELGAQMERRSLRALLKWQDELAQCRFDQKRNRHND